MIIDCIGCLHGAYPKLEGGDLLIVTGDLTARDTLIEHSVVLEWLHRQPYPKKVLIAGNHDHFLEKNTNFYSKTGINYLCDSGTEVVIDGNRLKIWGSPWSAQCKGINPKCRAFTIPVSPDMEDRLMDKWDLIPLDTDILITHSPPFGILDGIPMDDGSLFHVGSPSLRTIVLSKQQFKLHAFSHIHENGGKVLDTCLTKFVNASIMNERYRPVNKPVRITL